jgi:hypothetical protein
VTENKKGGHGIGLVQVRDALKQNEGKLEIASEVEQGTKMMLVFPKLAAPAWIAEEIRLGSQDIIIILDDDSSIHGAWDARLVSILKDAPDVRVHHFKEAVEACDFINGLDTLNKGRVFLLTDYELLRQNLNGLDVIAETQVSRSVLVTSHFANKNVLKRAAIVGTKILPKLLASEIPIIVDSSTTYGIKQNRKVNLVLVDDNKVFAHSLKLSLRDVNIDCYQSPYELLDHIDKYSKDIKICLDNDFNVPELNGVQLAEKLHNMGFTNLYLVSGKSFFEDTLPSYLKLIDKTDIEAIKRIPFSS